MKKMILIVLVHFFVQLYSQNPVQDFNFNGSLINSSKTATFNGKGNFVTDRLGNPKGAQRLVNESLEGNFGNLPQGNAPRTISIWIKFNVLSDAQYIWGYGATTNSKYCGLIHQSNVNENSDLNIAGWGPDNDLIMTTTLSANTWYNYIFTFDGITSSIYRNGQLLHAFKGPNRNTLGSVFRIGKVSSLVSINADIDDLKIYDRALSAEQAANIYDSSPILASNEDLKTISKTSMSKPKTAAQTKKLATN